MNTLSKKQRKAIKNKVLGRRTLGSLQRVKNAFPNDARKILEMRAQDKNLMLPAYAWPGGYPIFYVAKDVHNRFHENIGVVCPKCANGQGYLGGDDGVVDYDVNWEDPDLICEACNERIESAYAEPEEG